MRLRCFAGLKPQKGALNSRGEHGRMMSASQLDVMPDCGLGRATVKLMGVYEEKQ